MSVDLERTVSVVVNGVPREATVPVRFTDGAGSFGPIPLGQVPAVF